MPAELQDIRASEFIRIDPHEQLDLEASKQALQALARACRKRGLDRALLDLRAVPVPARRLFTPRDLGELVLTFRDAGFSREQRLAVMCEQDVHGGVRDFAFISRMRGLKVQVFADYEDALHWLSEEQESSAGEDPVLIRKNRSETKKVHVGLTSGESGGKVPRPPPRKKKQ
jgi:hypothetical protein